MRLIRRFFAGGSAANEQLTALAAAVLILLLAAEGATLLNIRSLLTVHAFVGMLLIPVVALKLASTGWRMLRYYLRGGEYTRLGPPRLVMRALVAPVIVLSTLVLFGTGVALLVRHQTRGTLVGLHKATFVLWLVVAVVHVLAHTPKVLRSMFEKVPGAGIRVAAVAVTVVLGLGLATATLPAADRLQDRASATIGLDAA